MININYKVRRFGSLDRLSCFPFEGKIKHVLHEKAGTRNFGEQIANRLVHYQNSRDLAREDYNNCDTLYSSLLKNFLNEPNSLNDGNYSSINSTLNYFEIQLIIRFLNIEVEDFTHADLKIFGRIRQNNQVFYADVYDKNHKRQSCVCKWLNKNEECYGIIHKFVKYKANSVFIASKFQRKTEIFEIRRFSNAYKTILQINNFKKYFPVFEKYNYDDINVVVCGSDTILATCILTNIEDSNFMVVTPVIGFEHD